MTKFRRLKLSPIERGWSGSRMPGRSIGPPDPVGDGKYLLSLKTKLCLRFKTKQKQQKYLCVNYTHKLMNKSDSFNVLLL